MNRSRRDFLGLVATSRVAGGVARGLRMMAQLTCPLQIWAERRRDKR